MDRLSLDGDEVHLWWANCEEMPGDLESVLPDEDQQRAKRLRVPAARRRFLAARSVTRILLGRYLGVEPAAVRIRTGARGKPRVEAASGHPGLHFNAAHSGATVAVALASSELGVDVESLRRVPKLDRLASRFCSEFERKQLFSLTETDRAAAFLTLWTSKEAYLKAVGSGIAMPLKLVEVALGPPRLVRVAGDPHAAAEWTLLHSMLPEPATCTAAIRGGSRRLLVRRFG